jgi:hypothetical protein
MIDKIINGVQAMAMALTNTVNKNPIFGFFIYIFDYLERYRRCFEWYCYVS